MSLVSLVECLGGSIPQRPPENASPAHKMAFACDRNIALIASGKATRWCRPSRNGDFIVTAYYGSWRFWPEGLPASDTQAVRLPSKAAAICYLETLRDQVLEGKHRGALAILELKHRDRLAA